MSSFIIPYTKERHFEEMNNDSVVYLSIYENDTFSGFIILSIENETKIEFSRIVVDRKGKGIGQAAISMMEEYCRKELRGERIWLDVFESNVRGQHIYRKMGFTETGTSSYHDKNLLYFEKML
ncbi:GNAT family N-acetyltransferase [Vreelandella sp. 21]|uniref:GNAT family N-acetyltransferase n=1 Tax=Vreelandella sp. 21 TaxID=3402864 RepID=UPI003D9A298E